MCRYEVGSPPETRYKFNGHCKNKSLHSNARPRILYIDKTTTVYKLCGDSISLFPFVLVSEKRRKQTAMYPD